MKMNYYRAPTAAPALPTLAEAIFAAKTLGTWSRYVTQSGLDELLAGNDHFTVFAPTDEAFRNLPTETLDALIADPKRLREVLEYHVIAGAREQSAFRNGKLKSLQGTLLTAAITDDGLVVDHANTCGRQVACANGMIHPIDAVLMPGYTPTLSGQARRDSAWTGKRDPNRPPPAQDNDWPFLAPRPAKP